MIRSIQKPKLVVIGNGMAGARLLEDVLALAPDLFDITVFGDEPYGNYNRILLSNVLNGTQDAKEIFLNPLAWYEENGITLHAGKRVTRIDRDAKTVFAEGLAVEYDYLVFATGSKPFIPPIPGTPLHGVFAFRTLDDCRNIAAYAKDCKTAVVIGGGLLGLEAAKGLMTHNVEVTVVEMAPWLMNVQLDEAGGKVLGQTIEKLGIKYRTGTVTKELLGHLKVSGVKFGDGSEIPADMVVISAGIRPNAELAKECGIACDRAIVVDDQLRTDDPAVFGVGECVQHNGMIYGLVAPLWEQTKVLAQVLTGTDASAAYPGSKIATKLKVMGVELASMGRINDLKPTDEVVSFSEPGRDVYWKAIVRDGKLSAACMLGDLGPADDLVRLFHSGADVPARRLELFFTAGSEKKEASLADLPDSHQICDCNGVCKGTIVQAIKNGKCTLPAVGKATRAGTGCGSCKKLVKGLIEAVAGGVKADPSESWYVAAVPLDKPSLVAAVKERGLKSVSAVLRELGTADDEKSRNGLASMLKGIWGTEYIDERDSRFVNDRVHANIQKDGTFSVVPRVYGGVTTADDLIRIGEVAKKYAVPMVKFTGGQRIDLLGIKKEDLPGVWADLGMPSGYAYTKALRTVKTCVGSEWCRFGTQDSTGLGVKLERMSWGSWMPHKFKIAVSGCPRNCAEATIKDFGVVCVDSGYELHVGGNGGIHVRATDLLCKVANEQEAMDYCAAFIQLYREEARYLERTAPWIERVGLDHIKARIVDDDLGRDALRARFLFSQSFSQDDPWAQRAEGAEAEHHAPMARFIPQEELA